ncbi:aspartate kinase [Fibrobacter sp. HC4]|uniref:aspartate kinase n=1 Tax=Fibrobacter sp. HC4 TaxID=3239812 RepID=UPI002019524C|nr:aspartate kinase [Fibrobacter succinogenes]MCL4102943.1 Aspartokinase 3 [Fibrobacter succinogenes]
MSRIVCKFGGSSVADAGQFKKIKNIVSSDAKRKVVVVSAPGKRNPKETKLTDLLYSTYDLASKHLDFSQPWNLIRNRYLEICSDLGIEPKVAEDLDILEKQLRDDVESITTDYLVSRGEYLSARVMSVYLGAEFVDTFPIITFDEKYRILPSSYETIAKALSDENKLYVLPGFYGSNTRGELKTFSRGGSDITGAILANAIDAETYENWTDVSGMLMADPRIVENPLPIEYVSYREIRELAYSGASVLHDESIAPCRAKKIPINIRNTNRPEDAGTIIGPTPESTKLPITGVAGRKGFSMIYIEKSMMNKEVGFGRRVLAVLESEGLSYELCPSAIDSMSIVVDTKKLEAVEHVVMEDITQQMHPDRIKIFKGISLIATVGHGMTNKIGVAAKLFTALAENQVNVRIIDQGSSQINIITGVDEDDMNKAIKAIYDAFTK